LKFYPAHGFGKSFPSTSADVNGLGGDCRRNRFLQRLNNDVGPLSEHASFADLDEQGGNARAKSI